MDFEQLVDGVITNTNRPELRREIEQAILRSTQRMHQLDYFHADLSEGSIDFPATLTARIDTKKLGATFRKMHSIFPFVGGMPVDKPIPQIPTDRIFDKAGKQGYYVLGSTLNIFSHSVLQKVLIRFFSLPLTRGGSEYNSWIADRYPFAIIDDASAVVLASVGQLEKANRFRQLVGEKLPRPTGHIADILANEPFGDNPDDYPN